MHTGKATRQKQNPFEAAISPSLLLQSRITFHAIFWLCLITYEGLISGMVDDQYLQRITISFIELPMKIIATYFTLYVLIDKLLIHKKYSMFVMSFLLSMIAFGILARTLAYYTIYPLYWPQATTAPLLFFPKILIGIFSIYSVVAIVASFHLMKHWYRHQQTSQYLQRTTQQLEKEKLEAELKLLKSQINPHFLFNTLNNLYALTLQKSHKAPEMVYKLSQLMTYMLYDSNQPDVPLQKEIQYIQNYIALEKVRYDRLDVSLNVYDVPDSIHIAPLLILPFVENAFKHGVSNQLSGGWVRVDILLQENILVLKVENSKNSAFIPEKKPASGIGLQNMQKRLDLIYPNRYSLQLMDEDETYLAILRITLTETTLQKKIITPDQLVTI